jgi:hypothetical protein
MPTSEIYVVETSDGEVLLGQLVFGPGTVSVLTGFAGRPAVLDQDEIESIVPASVHPDVEGSLATVPAQPGPPADDPEAPAGP